MQWIPEMIVSTQQASKTLQGITTEIADLWFISDLWWARKEEFTLKNSIPATVLPVFQAKIMCAFTRELIPVALCIRMSFKWHYCILHYIVKRVQINYGIRMSALCQARHTSKTVRVRCVVSKAVHDHVCTSTTKSMCPATKDRLVQHTSIRDRPSMLWSQQFPISSQSHGACLCRKRVER